MKKLLLIVVGMLMALPTFALDFTYEYEGQTLKYEVVSETDKTVSVAAVNKGIAGDLKIPDVAVFENVEYSVILIGNYAFFRCSDMTSVEIPNSVTSIGESAFEGCTGLTELTIPSAVTSIAQAAFSSCSGIERLYFNAENCETCGDRYSAFPTTLKEAYIGDNVKSIPPKAFCNCTELTSVTIPNSVTSIGNYAFSYCTGFTEINIPDSVTSIGSYAFSDCSELTSINIPDSVTEIGDEAFSGCTGLTYAEFASIEALCKISFGCGDANPLLYANHLYINGEEVTELVIPESITSIGNYTFAGCIGLTEITIPTSVTEIGDYAFYYCAKLTSLTIGNSVTSIGNFAFYNCRSLISLTMGNSVTSIGSYAFFGCIDLPYVEFASIEALCKINFGDGFANPLSWAHHLYINGEEVTELVIPESVTSIRNHTFANCKSLTSVTIPNSVTSIGDYAFDYCIGLTEITIPESVTEIGKGAFYECIALTSVTIPNSVTSISNNTFRYSGLTEITIPNSVTSIGSAAFYQCSKLSSVTIGNSVTKIEDSAFYDCRALRSLTIGSSFPEIGEKVFYNCNIETLSLDCENILSWFQSKSSIKTLILGNNVKSIGSSAFSVCSGLTSVTIGKSVSSIGVDAFWHCDNLTEVKLQDVNKWSMINFGNETANPIYYAKSFIVGDSDKPAAHLDLNLGDKSVSEYAFYNAQKLTTVRVKGAAIGANAFAGCCSIRKICLDVDAMYRRCFTDDFILAEVYSLKEVPPTAFDNSFSSYNGVTLYVPGGCVERYKNAECWRKFLNVCESDFAYLDSIFKADYENVGIEFVEIRVDNNTDGIDYNTPYEVYNFNGLRVGNSVENLTPGIYIIRQGNTIKKIAIK